MHWHALIGWCGLLALETIWNLYLTGPLIFVQRSGRRLTNLVTEHIYLHTLWFLVQEVSILFQ